MACARAGIAGYVTQDATLQELTQRIREATVGEFSCPPRVAATLLRNLAAPRFADDRQHGGRAADPARVRDRPTNRAGHVQQEIARHLTIQLATVKNHVHNILEKLAVRRSCGCCSSGPIHLRFTHGRQPLRPHCSQDLDPLHYAGEPSAEKAWTLLDQGLSASNRFHSCVRHVSGKVSSSMMTQSES